MAPSGLLSRSLDANPVLSHFVLWSDRQYQFETMKLGLSQFEHRIGMASRIPSGYRPVNEHCFNRREDITSLERHTTQPEFRRACPGIRNCGPAEKQHGVATFHASILGPRKQRWSSAAGTWYVLDFYRSKQSTGGRVAGYRTRRSPHPFIRCVDRARPSAWQLLSKLPVTYNFARAVRQAARMTIRKLNIASGSQSSQICPIRIQHNARILPSF